VVWISVEEVQGLSLKTEWLKKTILKDRNRKRKLISVYFFDSDTSLPQIFLF